MKILKIATRSVLALAIVLSATACSSSSETRASAEPARSVASSASAKHAHGHVADAKPGSHEDWCDEHAVPESKCTRCNPKLIPAFRATKDWCEEHSLPESQCTKCNPDVKIVRPPEGS